MARCALCLRETRPPPVDCSRRWRQAVCRSSRVASTCGWPRCPSVRAVNSHLAAVPQGEVDHSRSQQITADHSRPQQITAAHSRSQPTNAFTRAQLSGVSRSVCVLVVHRTYPTPDVSHPLVSHPRALVLCAAVTIVEWRAFSYFLSPTRMSLAHRHKQPSSTSDVWEGRRVEAAWVEAQVWETRQVHHARKMALAAFCAHMDPQANPVGMLDAVLSYQHFL